MKTCRICKVTKPLVEFYKQAKNKDGLKTECKTCHYKNHKEYRKGEGGQTEKQRELERRMGNYALFEDLHYKRTYGITLEDYNKMLKEQNNRCKICGQEETAKSRSRVRPIKKLAVDHDHKTGKVRGLLCHQCNVILGQYEKYKDDFYKFHNYLEMHKIKTSDIGKIINGEYYGNAYCVKCKDPRQFIGEILTSDSVS